MHVTSEQPPDDDLRDAVLHQEIELVGELVVAATSAPEHLTQAEIDRLLGVGRAGDVGAAGKPDEE